MALPRCGRNHRPALSPLAGTRCLWYNTGRPGYLTLTSVLIGGAAIALATIGLMLTAIQAGRNTLTLEQSAQARALANTCVEQALGQVRASGINNHSDQTTLGGSTCTYLVIAGSDGSGVVAATSTVGSIVRKVRVIIATTSPRITLTSWQEVGE
ncbi:MAG: hypothetical protein HYV42_05800 [Candidatus Magasanikbacteria bacterium]|nr:hypothetical protein [Candidatus Magasanikbacteria bacterium]